MAETNEFFIVAKADVSDAQSKLAELATATSNLSNKVGDSVDKINTSFGSIAKKVGSSFSSLGSTLSIGITAPLALLGKSLFDNAASIEQISISFEVFTGSAETAKNMLAELKNQALNSPMQFQDITKGAQTLLGYGLTAQQVIPITKMLGDISGGNADKFSRLSLAFGQVNAAGRLMGQETRQMINAGFNPLQAISEKTGESMASLTKRMHDGQISVQEVANAFQYATSEGGRFFGMADKQSNTLRGQMNKLQESISFAFAEIGTSLAKNVNFQQFITSIINKINSLKDSFLALSPETQTFILKLGLIIAAIGPILLLVGKLISVIGVITTGVSVLAGEVAVLTANFIALNIASGGFLLLAGLFTTAIAAGVIYSNGVDSSISDLEKRANATPKMADTITEAISTIKAKITELENTKGFGYVSLQYDVLTGKLKKGDASVEIKRLKDELKLLEAQQGKMFVGGFSNTPAGTDKKGKEKVEVIPGLDFQTKEMGTKIKSLIQISKDAEAELFSNQVSGNTKRLLDLKTSFDKQRAEFVKYGVATYAIDLKYSLDRGAILEDEKNRRLGIMNELMDKSIKQFRIANPFKIDLDQTNFDVAVETLTSQDKLNKIQTYTESLKSALTDMSIGVYTGFGQIVGGLVSGMGTFESVFDAVGNMFLSLMGDLLIQIGTSAIKLGITSEAVATALSAIGLPGAGFAAIAVGTLAVAAGYALKGLSAKNSKGAVGASSSVGTSASNSMSSRSSGASYQYGGASYSAQTVRLSVDLTGSITATQTGYSINKSLETTLRVTGR